MKINVIYTSGVTGVIRGLVPEGRRNADFREKLDATFVGPGVKVSRGSSFSKK